MDQRLFAPTHGLSQLITSFIASVSQGIRHAPFPTFIDNAAPRGRRALILSVAPNYQGAGKTYVSFLLQSCLYNMSKIGAETTATGVAAGIGLAHPVPRSGE